MNDQFYYSDGINKFGPFSLEELRLKGISKNTLVWKQGMADWKRAETFPELADMYISSSAVPPTPPVQNTQQHQAPASGSIPNGGIPPKSWLVESILILCFCCMPFGLVALISASKVESSFKDGKYDQAERASLEAKKWVQWGFWLGLASIAAVVLFYGFFFLAAYFAS